jgi:hypothetical protein
MPVATQLTLSLYTLIENVFSLLSFLKENTYVHEITFLYVLHVCVCPYQLLGQLVDANEIQ